MAINQNNILKLLSDMRQSEGANLLIVTKKQTVKDINELIEMGFNYFGENRVQEANEKYLDILDNKKINLDLIGPLQTNKVKTALTLFDGIQSIDRIKLINEIVKIRDRIETKTKNFFLQVNIGEEPQKSGALPNDLKTIYDYSQNVELPIKGLMCIPPNDDSSYKYFKKMCTLRDQLNQNLLLSMGMSHDYIAALKCGANIIRVGSLIFEE